MVILGHSESILQLFQRPFKFNFTLRVDKEGVVSAQVFLVDL
jgi:hypothetical protein